jgi:endonuclease/exonuclease/phosphatase family metal-dependent hydrolase
MPAPAEPISPPPPPADDPPPAGPRPRRLVRLLVANLTFFLCLLLALSLLGHLLRDRAVWLALLMDLPLLPIALAGMVVDLARRGRSIPRARYAATVVALAAATWGLRTMTGRGPDVGRSPELAVNVLQWNVQWGGPGGPKTWAATADAIAREPADVVVLNEAPGGAAIDQLCARLGPAWSAVWRENPPGSRYWYRVAVASHWPVHFEREVSVPNGAAIAVLIEPPNSLPLRVLAVDGMSDPRIPRAPLLGAIADYCQIQAHARRPVDVVAGDFNTVAASIGFDRFERSYFRLASRRSSGWRGTFPAVLPVYDIDHIWFGARLRPVTCHLFSSPGTNHRGQAATAEWEVAR